MIRPSRFCEQVTVNRPPFEGSILVVMVARYVRGNLSETDHIHSPW